MTKEELKNKYIEVIKTFGFFPKLDGDGDICFPFEGETFYLFVSENDPEFVRIVNLVGSRGDMDVNKVYPALDYANNRTKVGKINFVSENKSIWASVELFVKPEELTMERFTRYVKVTKTLEENFKEEFVKINASSNEGGAESGTETV